MVRWILVGPTPVIIAERVVEMDKLGVSARGLALNHLNMIWHPVGQAKRNLLQPCIDTSIVSNFGPSRVPTASH